MRFLLISAVILAVSGFGVPISATAQPYIRHALIEEGTGTWCDNCPKAAYTIDSLTRTMGSQLVAISWHGPRGRGEDMFVPQTDTLEYALGGNGSYPWASFGRSKSLIGAPGPWPNKWDTLAQAEQVASPVMLRIVDGIYRDTAVDFTLEISVLDTSALPKEDTTRYAVVVVLTEDGIVSPQVTPQGTIANFVHHNVARELATSVLGDSIPLLTLARAGQPVRLRYHLSTDDPTWVQDSLRVKAIVLMQGASQTYGSYLDAAQSEYITRLPNSGVKVSASSGGLSVFPNPATERMTITVPSADVTAAEFVVYDAIGHIVLKLDEVLHDEIRLQVDASSLPSGEYELVVFAGEAVYRSRFVVAR